jgi:hypothetical protein
MMRFDIPNACLINRDDVVQALHAFQKKPALLHAIPVMMLRAAQIEKLAVLQDCTRWALSYCLAREEGPADASGGDLHIPVAKNADQ